MIQNSVPSTIVRPQCDILAAWMETGGALNGHNVHRVFNCGAPMELSFAIRNSNRLSFRLMLKISSEKYVIDCENL